jgi:YQGE family putative transporter
MFKQFLAKETTYFNKLHTDTRKLLLSIMLYDLISPLLGIFINAFLWRQSQNLVLVAFYNLAYYVIIPFSFYINGHLLQKFSPRLLYFLSIIGQVVTTALLIFFPSISYLSVIIFGLLNGFFTGTYWANRNLLTLKTTQSENRIYFSSIESISMLVNSIIVPLFIGWFIILGSTVHLYSPQQGYQMIAVLALCTLGILARIMKRLSIKKISIGELVLKKVSHGWRQFQYFQFAWGINEGATVFLSTLLILILVGKEGSLGTVQSASAILTALVTFGFAKYLKVNHRVVLVIFGVFLTIAGAVIFGLFYSAIGIFIMVATQNIATTVKWIGFSSLSYDLMEKDGTVNDNHYAYLCDQEIYLGAGRVAGILLFILLAYAMPQTTVLRFAPVIFSLTQLFLITTSKAVDQYLTKEQPRKKLFTDAIKWLMI